MLLHEKCQFYALLQGGISIYVFNGLRKPFDWIRLPLGGSGTQSPHTRVEILYGSAQGSGVAAFRSLKIPCAKKHPQDLPKLLRRGVETAEFRMAIESLAHQPVFQLGRLP